MIAGDSESDWWILYANKETTLEIAFDFDLNNGRFKVFWVRPDQTVQTLNESGEENTVKLTLPEGRNEIRKDVSISFSGMKKKDFDGVYGDENLEYAYRVLKGKRPVDPARLEEVCLYLKKEEVSALAQIIWKEGLTEDVLPFVQKQEEVVEYNGRKK